MHNLDFRAELKKLNKHVKGNYVVLNRTKEPNLDDEWRMLHRSIDRWMVVEKEGSAAASAGSQIKLQYTKKLLPTVKMNDSKFYDERVQGNWTAAMPDLFVFICQKMDSDLSKFRVYPEKV